MRRFLPGGRWALSVLLAGQVLLGGLVGTAALVSVVRRGQEHALEQVLEQRAQVVGSAVDSEITRYVDALSDLAVSIGAQSELRASDFASLTSRLNDHRLPGASAAVLVVPARDGEVAAVQRYWRARGNADLRLRPAPGPDHLFSVLSRTLDGRPNPDGVDLTAAAEPTEALRVSRERGRVAASPTYVLLRDRDLPPDRQQRSFLLAAPVYAEVGTPDAGTFRGWIVLGLRGEDFVSRTMGRAAQQMVSVTLSDVPGVGQGAMVIATSGDGTRVVGDQSRTVTIAQAGRHWQLLVRPTERLRDLSELTLAGLRPAVLAGAAGGLLTVLLTALVAALSASRQLALQRVDRATAALRADIERRELLEQELRERQVELQAFAGVVAHDLKAPLANVQGYVDLLTDCHSQQLDGAAQDYLARITHNGHRMQSLIDDLLSYSLARDKELNRRPVDLAELARSVIGDRVVGADPEPRVEIGRLPVVEGDAVLLRQLLDNLVGNALKYVRPGRVPFVGISATDAGGAWLIEVADAGIGVAEADREAVFGTFQRARGSEDYPGTGLGLAICKRIVERHGGAIGVEPGPGGGSAFWFTLPGEPRAAAASAAAVGTSVPSEQERGSDPGHERVLYTE